MYSVQCSAQICILTVNFVADYKQLTICTVYSVQLSPNPVHESTLLTYPPESELQLFKDLGGGKEERCISFADFCYASTATVS
jgi:hypothetical protein